MEEDELLPEAAPVCPAADPAWLPEAALGWSLEDGFVLLWLWLAEESGVAVEDCPLMLPDVLEEADGLEDWLAAEPGAVAEAPLCVAAPELWLLVGVAVVSFAGA